MEGVYRGSLETKQAGVLHAGFTKYIAFLGRLTIGRGMRRRSYSEQRYHDPTLQLHGLPCSIFQGGEKGGNVVLIQTSTVRNLTTTGEKRPRSTNHSKKHETLTCFLSDTVTNA